MLKVMRHNNVTAHIKNTVIICIQVNLCFTFTDMSNWQWVGANGGKMTFSNWFGTCRSKRHGCASLITGTIGEATKGKWIETECNQNLSYICQVKKGKLVNAHTHVDALHL